jgi:hypothetical protein
MNASIWGSDILRRGVGGLRDRDWEGLVELGLRMAMVALAPLAAIWATSGVGGRANEAGGFGFYSMSLDALINPGRPNYSRVLPAAPQGQGQVFEGFQYLGAGLLGLLLVAAVALLASRSARRQLWRLRPLVWLAPAMFVLAALALSGYVQLHGRIVRVISYDWLPLRMGDMFRSSGRLFWPSAYLLVLVAIRLVFALPRAWSFAVGLGALALQAFDLPGFVAAARAQTAPAAGPATYAQTPSPKWDALIAAASIVEFQPTSPHVDETAFYELAWRASSMGRPINIMYAARSDPNQAALEAAARHKFLAGEIDPKRLYVVLDGCAPAGLPAERFRQVNGVAIIPPAGGRYSTPLRSAPIPPPFPLAQTVSAEVAPAQLRCILGGDWSLPEPWGVWSDGPAPELIFRLATPPRGDLVLTLSAHSFPPEGQGVTVVAGGRNVARWLLRGEPGRYRARIPHEVARGLVVGVVLKVDRPQSLSSRGLYGADGRQLGVGLRSVRLDPVE